jgi:integrase
MSRRPTVPSCRLHKQSGQAVVTLPDGLGGRRDVLLGKYDTETSKQEYRRVVLEWEANGRRPPVVGAEGSAPADLTVNELILAYWHFAEGYYVKNGEPTSQQERVQRSLKPLKELYGHTMAKLFGPLALKAVREWMVRAGWTRGHVNSCVGCVKRAFKWAVENEMVPPSVYHGLQAVAGLKKGRSGAKETQPVRPVPDEHVDAVLPFLTPPVRAMVQVQRLAGMRPCEVVIMRPCDIDWGSGKTWVYRPESHKTEHHGIARVIFLGPQAQEVLRPFLDRAPGAYLFSPRQAVEGYLRATGRRVRHARSRTPGERYAVSSYDRAIANACRRAGVAHFAPNQLRHTKATEIRREAGLDAARAVLGHRSSQVTEVYAEVDFDKAAEVMERLG